MKKPAVAFHGCILNIPKNGIDTDNGRSQHNKPIGTSSSCKDCFVRAFTRAEK
jgi:hypothetical protein